MDIRVLVEDNLYYLQQAVSLIERLDDDLYARNDLPYAASGVGKHIRHVIGFYECLLRGRGSRVDYDRRQRDPDVETDRSAARERIIGVQTQLKQLLPEDDSSLWVRCDERLQGAARDPFTASTLSRELQFLVSHTIHHWAIVALILRTVDHPVPPDFGVAPSTLLSGSRNRPDKGDRVDEASGM